MFTKGKDSLRARPRESPTFLPNSSSPWSVAAPQLPWGRKYKTSPREPGSFAKQTLPIPGLYLSRLFP